MTENNNHNDPNVILFQEAQKREALKKARLFRRPAMPAEPIFNLPPTVKVLCLINIGIFLIEAALPAATSEALIYELAFVPARYFGDLPLGLSGLFSPLTHMFIHAGWLHLAINLGMLMAFGAGLEKALGGRKLLLFYFLAGLAGAFAHALTHPAGEMPMIGASGAISGLFGGVVMMMSSGAAPGQLWKSLMPFVLIWVAVSIIFGVAGMPGSDNPIAWMTHIGGFLGGLLLYRPLLRLNLRQ